VNVFERGDRHDERGPGCIVVDEHAEKRRATLVVAHG
jgi:hypothetical protein